MLDRQKTVWDDDQISKISLESDDFRRIVETAMDGVAVVTNRKVSFVSKRAADLFGYPQKDLIGRHIYEFFPPEELTTIALVINKRESGLYSRGINETVVMTKGGNKNIELASTSITLNDQISIIIFLNDISQRIEGNEIREKQLQFQKLVAKLSNRFVNLRHDQINSGIDLSLREIGEFGDLSHCFLIYLSNLTRDIELIFEWTSGGYRRLLNRYFDIKMRDFGRFTKDLQDNEYLSLKNIPTKHKNLSKKFFGSNEIGSCLLVPLISDNSMVGLAGFSNPDPDYDWPPDTLTLLTISSEIFVNALERRKNEEEISKLHQTQTLLYSQTAHSLKTSFSVAIGNLEMLQRTKSDKVRKEMLGMIRESIDDANKQISQIFEVAKLDRQPSQKEFSVLDVTSLFKEISTKTEFLFKSYYPDIESTKCIVFQTPEEGELIAHRQELVSALMMIIDNALLHSPKEKELPCVHIIGEIGDSELNISIKDHGKGIDPIDLPRVFDLFYRGKDSFHGSGIGLAQAKKTLEVHHGKIQLSSEPENGTVCLITIPLLS